MSTRRTFITLLGGAAAAWPLAARAQQPQRVRRIGVLTHLGSDDPDLPPRASAFSRGLQELGWFDGRNARIEYRFGAGNTDRRWLGSTTFANTIGIALVASSSGRMVENPLGEDHIGTERDHFCSKAANAGGVAGCPARINPQGCDAQADRAQRYARRRATKRGKPPAGAVAAVSVERRAGAISPCRVRGKQLFPFDFLISCENLHRNQNLGWASASVSATTRAATSGPSGGMREGRVLSCRRPSPGADITGGQARRNKPLVSWPLDRGP